MVMVRKMGNRSNQEVDEIRKDEEIYNNAWNEWATFRR